MQRKRESFGRGLRQDRRCGGVSAVLGEQPRTARQFGLQLQEGQVRVRQFGHQGKVRQEKEISGAVQAKN